MTPCAELRVLFRLAAGPRRGFGHLVRCISLARAMGVRPLFSVRGPSTATDTALSLGADVLGDGTPRSVIALSPDVLVVDDPVGSDARRWVRAGRRAGALVVTIHDLGLGFPGGDLVIDGSVTRQARRSSRRVTLRGARYAILDPNLPRAVRATASAGDRRILVALGGGRRRAMALAIGKAIVAADPDAQVRIAGGFSAPRPPGTSPNITWITPSRGLGRELARATVAVVGGGVSLYEACAAGVSAVGVPVVRSQTPTVRAFTRKGAVIGMPFGTPGQRTAAAVIGLLDNPRRRVVLARRAMQIVDGRGAARAAAAVLSFTKRRRS
jgi:spore coat polysaccharide biosynthesis predicted glycosyltransferase SpsG